MALPEGEQLDLFWRAHLVGGPLNGRTLEVTPEEGSSGPPRYIQLTLNYNPKMSAVYHRGAIKPKDKRALYFIFGETDKNGSYL